MFQHLLVPLDGTQAAEAALPLAAWLAEKTGARVTLLHVVERGAPATVHGEHHLTSAPEAESYLEQIARTHFPLGVRVDRHVHRREIIDVAHSVADHADEFEPDLIIMLAHGRRGLRQWFFGTIAQRVVRQSPTPILLVKPGADGKIHVPFRRVLVPLDGHEEHEAGLPGAAEIARLAGTPMRLLVVVPTFSALGGPDAATGQLLPAATREMLDQAQQQAVDYLGQHLERLQREGIEASAGVARGEPADVIHEIVLKEGADLVALGTHGTAGIEAFWSGSLGQRLLGRVPASFLLAPAGVPARTPG